MMMFIDGVIVVDDGGRVVLLFLLLMLVSTFCIFIVKLLRLADINVHVCDSQVSVGGSTTTYTGSVVDVIVLVIVVVGYTRVFRNAQLVDLFSGIRLVGIST